MDKDKKAEQAGSFNDDEKPLFSKDNDASHAAGTAEAMEDDITLPGIERPGNEEVKEEINPNTE